MKDFRLYDIEDFVMDEDFIRWVKMGKKNDNDFWDNWLGKHLYKHIIIAEARRIIENLGSAPKEINETEKEFEVQRLLSTIREQSNEVYETPVVPMVRSKKWLWVAAAIFIAVAGTTAFSLLKNNASVERFDYAYVTSSEKLIENINTSEKPVNIKLPDGSSVDLSPNSRVAYPNNFDSTETRDIYLSGEALFTVTKNAAKPFRVFANEIVTKVLGTSFTVRSFDKDTAIHVIVKTGKVSVYSRSAAKESIASNHLGGIILSPNQEVLYQRSKQKFQKILLDDPIMVLPATADKTLWYEDASLEKVFKQLGDNYGINIVYDSELLKKCTITADLRNVPFFEKLELICKAIGAKYEIIEGQVVIQVNGCD